MTGWSDDAGQGFESLLDPGSAVSFLLPFGSSAGARGSGIGGGPPIGLPMTGSVERGT
jgi:hypothetical protein